MVPAHLQFGGGLTATFLHPLVAVGVLIAIVLIFTLPRKKVIAPFLFAVLMIPWGQQLVIGDVHFTMMRILILAGLARAAWSKSSSLENWFPGGFSGIDQAAMLWLAFSFIIVTLQWMNAGMLMASLGGLIDALGGYLVLRFFIPDGEAIRRTVKVLAAICAIHGACMIYERVTGVDVFSLVGGLITPDSIASDGVLRSAGLMGSLGEGPFAAVLLPLFVWLWKEEKGRIAAIAGLAGATAMFVTSHKSTSWCACGAALFALSCWPLRKQMRLVRWGIVLMLVALNMYMTSPVWHLIEDVNITGDSSSYHRYFLVDATIRHFSAWWLLGYKNYAAWGWDMWDTSNLFVATALTGGLISLVILILLFKRSFGAIGTARKQVDGDRKQEWFLWCLGSALFTVVASSFGIAFLYQSQVELYLLPAFIAVATFEAMRVAVQTAEAQKEEGPALAFVPAGAGIRSDLRPKLIKANIR